VILNTDHEATYICLLIDYKWVHLRQGFSVKR